MRYVFQLLIASILVHGFGCTMFDHQSYATSLSTKYIDWGTGAGQANARDIPANYTPINYTPAQAGSEGTDKVSSHLKGVDSALGSISGGDLTIDSSSVIGGTANKVLFENSSNQVSEGDLNYNGTTVLRLVNDSTSTRIAVENVATTKYCSLSYSGLDCNDTTVTFNLYGDTNTTTLTDSYLKTPEAVFGNTNTTDQDDNVQLSVEAEGANAYYMSKTFGGVPFLVGRAAEGTLASPTSVPDEKYLLRILGQGYDGSGYVSAGRLDFRASEAWSSGNNGSEFFIELNNIGASSTNPVVHGVGNGKIALGENVSFDPAARLTVYSGSDGDWDFAIQNSATGTTNADGFICNLSNNGTYLCYNKEQDKDVNFYYNDNGTERLAIQMDASDHAVRIPGFLDIQNSGNNGTSVTAGVDVSNIAVSTNIQLQWSRSGSTVTGCFGTSTSIECDTTSFAQLGLTLPVSSNFTSSLDCNGSAIMRNRDVEAVVRADITNDRCLIEIRGCPQTGGSGVFGCIAYEVK